MATIADIAEAQRLAITSLNQRMADFEEHLKASSQESDLSGLHKDYSAFKDHVWNVVSALQQKIEDVSRSIDAVEMRHRRKFLLLGGVPEKTDEKVPDIVIGIMQTQLGFADFGVPSLSVCHRLGTATATEGRPRVILVRFSNLAIKDAVWKNKTKLKGTPYVVSEFLTRQRQTTFTTARKLFGVSNVWTMDGNINIKLPDGKRRRIYSCEDVVALGAEFGKALDGPTDTKVSSKNASPAPPAQVSSRSRRNVSKK